MSKRFTLVELIISILVIAILVAIVLLNVSDFRKDVEEAALAAELQIMQGASDRYYLDHDEFPSDIQPKNESRELINKDKLYRDYIRKKPKHDFYVDEYGKVWLEKDGGLLIPVEPMACAEAEAEGYTCITTEEELKGIRNDMSGKYILMNNIILKDEDWNPIANEDEYYFNGELNGNGYSIKNLKTTEGGLFYAIGESGVVKNLNIERVEINDSYQYARSGVLAEESRGVVDNVYVQGSIETEGMAGGIAGMTYGGEFRNVHTNVDIQSNGSTVGGIVGMATYPSDSPDIEFNVFNSYSNSRIKEERHLGGFIGHVNSHGVYDNLDFSGEVLGVDSGVGGIIGFTDKEIKVSNTYAKGVIEGYEDVGGIIGFLLRGEVDNSHANAKVKGYEDVGGFAGSIHNNIKITNSSATGEVVGENGVGGFAGVIYSNSSITNSHSKSNVDGVIRTGGFLGEAHSSEIKNNYARGNVKGSTDIGGFVGANYTRI